MNALVVQSGGPTSVVNASLAGVIATCQDRPEFTKLWGCRLGTQGLMDGDWVDLTALPPGQIDRLRVQPGCALGSSRYRLADRAIPGILRRFRDHNIGAVFMIGGNGTMAAAHKLAGSAAAAGYRAGDQPLCVIGIPKTIDNDLKGTDFTPGYGSAARFVAQTTRDIGLDLRAMRTYDDVAVLEVMGRHLGWLAAASALARRKRDDAPHLILLPEIPLDEEEFLAAVRQIHGHLGVCLVVVAEGMRDTQGNHLAENLQPAKLDPSGQKMLSTATGVAPYLARLVQKRLGLLCRQMRPDTIQRSNSTLVSAVDRAAAAQVGIEAVVAAARGISDVLIGLDRCGQGWQTSMVSLSAVVAQERTVPPEFIASHNFDVTPEFLAYAAPLVGDLQLDAVLF